MMGSLKTEEPKEWNKFANGEKYTLKKRAPPAEIHYFHSVKPENAKNCVVDLTNHFFGYQLTQNLMFEEKRAKTTKKHALNLPQCQKIRYFRFLKPCNVKMCVCDFANHVGQAVQTLIMGSFKVNRAKQSKKRLKRATVTKNPLFLMYEAI